MNEQELFKSLIQSFLDGLEEGKKVREQKEIDAAISYLDFEPKQ